MTSDEKTLPLTDSDLSPSFDNQPTEESAQAAAPEEGLPHMANFHARLGVATYPGNTVIEMREEDER